MSLNLKDVLRHELIGSHIEIVDSKNKNNIGVKGKIINETKNMLVIKQKEKTKKIIKNQVIFTMKMNNKKIRIEGKYLVGRPEDRIKK